MKILSIGNSFSQDAQRYLHSIARADNRTVHTVNLYIGGCSLEQHFHNLFSDACCYEYQENGEEAGRLACLPCILEQGDWDIITLQQASGLSGIADSYFPYLTALLEQVRKTNPNARIALHQTWAYEWGSDHPDFPRYENDQDRMFAALCAANAQAAAQAGIRHIIPSGQIIQTLRENPLFNVKQGGISLCRDGFHMDMIYGRYAVGACWYEALCDGNILHNSYCPPEPKESDDHFLRLDTIRTTVHQTLLALKNADFSLV